MRAHGVIRIGAAGGQTVYALPAIETGRIAPSEQLRSFLGEWVAEGGRRGIRLRGDALRPRQDATTVRVRNGQVLVTDGPYTESKEWIVGYDLLECEDLDQAIDYVSRHPMARHGRIEIRPVMTDGG